MKDKPITAKQCEMLEKMLYPSDSNPFRISKEYRGIMEDVLIRGTYSDYEQPILNWFRDCYINKNYLIR